MASDPSSKGASTLIRAKLLGAKSTPASAKRAAGREEIRVGNEKSAEADEVMQVDVFTPLSIRLHNIILCAKAIGFIFECTELIEEI